MTLLENIISREALIITVIGFIGLCYFKTLKSILISNCTSFDCFCFHFKKKEMSDENINELINLPDENRRGVP